MREFYQIVGVESPVGTLSNVLWNVGRRESTTTVEALHVTCAEVSGAGYLQASLQHPNRTGSIASDIPLRTANLGAQYDWGAFSYAAPHIGLDSETGEDSRFFVIRINSHVGVASHHDQTTFGSIQMGNADLACCGPLHAALEAGDVPPLRELREWFTYDRRDRLAMLWDPEVVEPAKRGLIAAIVHSRLQARKAILDVQQCALVQRWPVLVIPCVTINRHDSDTEIVVGIYAASGKRDGSPVTYLGLEDDPSAYEVVDESGMIRLWDENSTVQRAVRDHRLLIWEIWRYKFADMLLSSDVGHRLEKLTRGHFERSAPEVRRDALSSALRLLADTSVGATSAMLFGQGFVGLDHIVRAYQLSSSGYCNPAIVREAIDGVDGLSMEEVVNWEAKIRAACENSGAISASGAFC